MSSSCVLRESDCFKESYNLSETDFTSLREKYSIGGVCAVCPDITFEGKVFCFTGESYRAKRNVMAEAVRALVELPGVISAQKLII